VRWGQAKAVMIAVFLLLDACLGWRLTAGQATAVAPAPAVSPTTLVQANVAGSAVRFEGVLPVAPASLPTLTIALRQPDAAAIASHLLGSDFQVERQGSIMTYAGRAATVQSANGAVLYQRVNAQTSTAPVPTASQARFVADGFVARMALAPSNLVFDRVAYSQRDGAWDVAYFQRYQGQPVFNGHCDVEVDNVGVLSANCLWANVVGPAQSPRPILDPAEALHYLADAQGATAGSPLLVDASQNAIVLGYVAATYPANAAWPTVPAWRIELADGSLYYVNAYTGTLVRGPS
jgi:hypothetical protein